MDFTKLSSFLVESNNYQTQTIISYLVIALIALVIVFIVLVNKNILMKKDNAFRRFITHPLFYYSLKRIGSALISIVLALAITFFLLRMQDLEGAFCDASLKNKLPSIEAWNNYCDSVKRYLGFGGNPIKEFFQYIYNIIPIPKKICVSVDSSTSECATQGWQFTLVFLGYNPKDNTYGDIFSAITQLIPNSFKWGSVAVVIQVVIGYPLGILMAKYQDKLVDKIGKGYIILVDAIPGLLYYYLLYALFSQLEKWGINIFPKEFDPNAFNTWLAPALTSAFAGIAGIAYWVRRYMLNEINSDYVKFARSKGLSENKIMFKHVLRNAIVPLSRSLSTAFISCLFGSFFIEKIFGIGGFGSYLTDAVQTHNFIVVQGVVVFSAILSVISYLIADIAMAIADPRISYSD